MLKNYTIIGWRNLLKNRTVSSINILGLVIGMISCLLIWRYVTFELSYDGFHTNGHRLHRITSQYDLSENPYRSALSTFNIGPALENTFPEVERFARLHPYSQVQFNCAMMYKDRTGHAKTFNESHLFYTDQSFFSIFSFPLTHGDPEMALIGPYSAVISQATAKKYFGNEDPLGKVLTLNSSSRNADYVVTGVMKDIPANSHLRPEILLSIKSLKNFENDTGVVESSEDRMAFYTYILLKDPTGPREFSEKLSLFSRKETAVVDNLVSFELQAIKDIHLHSDMMDEAAPGGSLETVYFLMALAFFIMSLAWINYLNLTTARFLERIKEFGVRKVSGASRYQLIKQCFVETFLILIVSTTTALIAGYLIFSTEGVKAYLGGSKFLMVDNTLWLVVVLFFCFGIIVSMYQALFLSSFKLTNVLKGRFTGTKKGSWLRKVLVVFQFTISTCLIIGIFTVYSQFKYMLDQEPGIDLEQKIIVKTPSNIDSTYMTKLESFKNELSNFTNIAKITISSIVPGLQQDWFAEVRKQNDSKDAYKNLAVYVLDADFFDVYNVQIVAGRGFLPEDQPGKRFGSKLENVIINETAVKRLGFQSYEEAINEIIYWEATKCRIVGVVADFHQQSLRHPIQPAIFTVNNRDSIFYSINLDMPTSDPAKADEILASTLTLIRQNWSRFFPDNPFEFYVLKDSFNDQYRPDLKLARVLGLFSALATFIACLGLFGLSAYATSQRTREIGIRKVLGATVARIFCLVSGDFLSLIVVAGTLAVPVAYFGVRHWLTYYAYSINIAWWFFAAPVVMVVLVALLTVSVHTIKASIGNPADALKYE